MGKLMKVVLITGFVLSLAAVNMGIQSCIAKDVTQATYIQQATGNASDNAAKDDTQGEPINTICPVMGTKIEKDTPYKVEYKGQVIGFCCPACIKAFKADPEKYIEKINNEDRDTAEEETKE